MKNFKIFAIALFATLFANVSFAQVNSNTGEIEVEAIFKEVIIITVKNDGRDNAKVQFVVDEVAEYRDGLTSEDVIDFSVASSVDYTVAMKVENTDFTSQTSAFKLKSNNFGLTIEETGSYEDGDELELKSGIMLLGEGATMVKGSAGDDVDNAFQLTFELGTKDVRDAQPTKLGALLGQNIPPATYTNNVILTAAAK